MHTAGNHYRLMCTHHLLYVHICTQHTCLPQLVLNFTFVADSSMYALLCTRWVHGGYMVGTWWVHGGYTVGTRWVHGGYTVGTRWVHGGYTVGTWWVHGGYTVGTWWVHTVMCHVEALFANPTTIIATAQHTHTQTHTHTHTHTVTHSHTQSHMGL